MSLYTDLCDTIKSLAEEDTVVQSVRKGVHIDLDKSNAFPMVHFTVNQATPTESTIVFEVAIFAMALRSHNNVPQTDRFDGSYQEDNNMDAMLDVITRLYMKLLLLEDPFRVTNAPSFEAFYEARMNVVDGWVGIFEIEAPLTTGAC
jgi:hypothetical protein